MKKTIITIYGRKDEGKSTTIRAVFKLLMETTPTPILDRKVSNKGDILVIMIFKNIKIGFESQGDPGSRMITKGTLKALTQNECDIIICASRTSGDIVQLINKVAREYKYNTLRLSSYYSPSLNKKGLNEIAATSVIKVIESLIENKL